MCLNCCFDIILTQLLRVIQIGILAAILNLIMAAILDLTPIDNNQIVEINVPTSTVSH